MEISKYGIVLHRLREEDTELVRIWRNSPLIRQYMEFRDEITPEMQKIWFHSIDNTKNFYFIIEYHQEKIGLINSSHVDWNTRSSEGGIFIWDEKYFESFVPVWASLCLLETSYHILGAGTSSVKILRENERAQKLVLSLGYERTSGQENVYNQNYILTPERFFRYSPRLIKAASLLAGQEGTAHTLFFDDTDIRSGLADFMDGKIDKRQVKTYTESVKSRFYEFLPTKV